MLECNPSHVCFEPIIKTKDEKLTEEYANKHTHYEVGRRENGVAYAKQVSDVTVQQAFLAGLKVGRQDEQLTKAKEIIKEFVFLLTHTRTALDTKTVMQKAEQFLKE